jgi:hypothetical protein
MRHHVLAGASANYLHTVADTSPTTSLYAEALGDHAASNGRRTTPRRRRGVAVLLVAIGTAALVGSSSAAQAQECRNAFQLTSAGSFFIYVKHVDLGGDTGRMGCAIGDEFAVPGGRARDYQAGTISWKSGAFSAYAVRSDIFRVWTASGRERGWLGFPESDDLTTSDGKGRFTHFEGGTLVRSSQVVAYRPTYTFSLDSYRIDNTRSLFDDTNYVYIAAKDSGNVRSQQRFMGDEDEGTYRPGLQTTLTITDPSKPASFAYTITNSGSGNNDALRQGLDKAVEIGSGAVAANSGPIVGAVAAGVGLLWKYGFSPLVFANCDGIVADAIIAGDYRLFADWTAGQHAHSETRVHPGSDSAHGCGDNSRYAVSWTITRWNP